MSESDQNFIVLQSVCSDKKCRSVLYFSSVQAHVDCLRCGQRHSRDTLQDVQTPIEVEGAEKLWLRDIILTNVLPKRGPEMVKVLGLSNYYCKLLSPLLTRYGMDKTTGRAKLLSDMNQGEIFDCGIFGDRAFLIEQEHILIPGYGRDITGSMSYLSDTLELINSFNDGEERLIPIHADGDGHCLVHAVSRALVGRELFWHPLRCCLKKHFIENIHAYKELFKDFVDEREWDCIVDECDPEFQPPDGELHGLRTIHIFGLANVLKRPIILLDSLECMKKLGDYAALFLPGLVSPNACRGKDNSLNKPLCIAWSNHSHTHYIPLIGVKRRPLPVLPRELIPKVWGMPQTQIYMYMEFDQNGNCTISGNRMLSDAYILRLVSAMETLFFDQNSIHPSIVADAQLYLYPQNGLPGSRASIVVNKVKQAVHESRLYRCLSCSALCELLMQHSWLKAGGILYNTALANHKRLVHNSTYFFPLHGIHCKYDRFKDELIPNSELTGLKKCTWCQDCYLHRVKSDGSVMNKNEIKFDENLELVPEDYSPLATEACESSEECVTEHRVLVSIEWNNRLINDVVNFNLKKKDSVTDVAYDIAAKTIRKHFPEEINNKRLQFIISEQILDQVRHPIVSPSPNIMSSKCNQSSNVEKRISDNKKVISTSSSAASIEDFSTAPKVEFVRVATSDGRQANLTLAGNRVSYSNLQSWIEDQFQIPVSSQKIRYGFPPKELQHTSPGDEPFLTVQHGDRIMVEICPIQEVDSGTTAETEVKAKESSECISPISSEDSLKSKMNVEMQWSVAKMSPSLFSKHGSIYSQIIEKHGKNDKKHIHLEAFPKKVFCYNSENDCIVLCSKPYGHFQIFMDIDYVIQETKKGRKMEGVSNCTLLNSKLSNFIPDNQAQSRASRPPPFSIENEQNKPSKTLVRKGPGFSVLTNPR